MMMFAEWTSISTNTKSTEKYLKSKEERMEKKVIETINALCDWIQTELKNASSVQTESILPAVIEATAKLVEQANHIY